MSHADITFDAKPRFTLPRWNPALNILAPLVGVALLAAIVAGPLNGDSTEAPPSFERATADLVASASVSTAAVEAAD